MEGSRTGIPWSSNDTNNNGGQNVVEATSSGYKTRNERKAQALRELMRKEVRSAKTAAAAAKADSKCLSPTKKRIRNYNLQSLTRDLPGDNQSGYHYLHARQLSAKLQEIAMLFLSQITGRYSQLQPRSLTKRRHGTYRFKMSKCKYNPLDSYYGHQHCKYQRSHHCSAASFAQNQRLTYNIED